jgi:colanic acid/amylovoran biosynthesis protein
LDALKRNCKLKKIILTNQHSDNRGDESAVVGVISSLRKYFGENTEIVIYLQSGTKAKFLTGINNVEEKSMLMGIVEILEMSLWTLFKRVGFDIRFLTTKRMKEFLQDHEEAILVISSCGGPYIGDIYICHEIFHVLHLSIPQLLGKKTAFFAPSMGPFKSKLMNFFRSQMLMKANVITLRDPISYVYLKKFLPKKKDIYLTTDSCLAYDVSVDGVDTSQKIIGITPIDYKFPLADNKQAKKDEYERAIINTLNTLMEENLTLLVEFFPQLYGERTDIPYIKKIIGKLKYPERTIIFSDEKGGVDQQQEIAHLDYMIACRYHSAIFACKVNTPVICVAYEHKAKGFMESVNLGDYCVDIYELDERLLLDKISMLQDNKDHIKKYLPNDISRLKDKANSTAEIIYKYVMETDDKRS